MCRPPSEPHRLASDWAWPSPLRSLGTSPASPRQTNLFPGRPRLAFPPLPGASNPGPHTMTDAQRTKAIELRKTGLSYEKIAKQIGASDSATWKLFHPKPPKPKPPPPPVIVKPKLLPSRPLRSSCPSPKYFNPDLFSNQPQPTKTELRIMLHDAVVATARMRA
jgi:hypothetical protein